MNTKKTKVDSLFKRIGIICIVLLVSVSSSAGLFPHKAQAGFLPKIVLDPFNHVVNAITAGASGLTAGGISALVVKGYALDPLAYFVAHLALQSVVNSTVKWIGSGFNGSPAFVTNLSATLQSVGDTAANQFIAQLTSNGSIKSPFQNQVASAVSKSYLQSTSNNGFFTQNAYTLNKVTTNDSAFLKGDLTQGGLTGWLTEVSQPQNNTLGANQLASNALSGQVAGAQSIQKIQLGWANGFKSNTGNCKSTTTGTGNTTSLSSNSGCLGANIITPGASIKSALDKSLGTGIDSLVSAHSLDELVSGLMQNLLNQGLHSIVGLSQPSTATGGTTYLGQTATSNTTLNSDVTGTLTAAVSSQLTLVQGFQSDWTTINNAAIAAKNALQSSICSPNAQAIITSTVQPVINQANLALAQASASITALNKINTELSSGSAVTNTHVATDYNNLVCGTNCGASVTLPTYTDKSNADTQSIDTDIGNEPASGTGTTGPVSALTQMNRLAQSAQTCGLTGR